MPKKDLFKKENKMKYDECREWLEDRRNKMGSVPGLDEVNKLLKEYDHPDDIFDIIHIAGTNGKGSIGYLLEHSLADSRIKTGRFLSPAVSDEREIITVNGKMFPKTIWEKHLTDIIEVISKKNINATAFEIEFVLALNIFKEAGCKIVILECGMGGLLDATNAVNKSLVDIISSISADHCNFLGNDLRSISLHKFGIIKQNSKNVVLSCQRDEINGIFDEYIKTHDIHADIHKCDKKDIKFKIRKTSKEIKQILTYKDHKDVELSLIGKHQSENAAAALEALDILKNEGFKINMNAIRKAFKNAEWIGRFDIIRKENTYILDGAHNLDAVTRLFENINLYFTNRDLIYIMGMYKDKAYEETVKHYAPLAKAIVTVTPKDKKRALDAFELGKEIKDHNENVTAADSYNEALEMAELIADKKDVILIFGSLSFMGDFKKLLTSK